MSGAASLEARAAEVRFGGLVAFSDVTFSIAPGTRTAIIGPNGAGKTTLLNAISGLVRLSSGSIRLDGRDLRGQPAHRRGGLGIGRTFQHSRLFGDQSLLDQVVCGAYGVSGRGLLPSVLRSPGFVVGERDLRERALDLLSRFGVADLAHRPAGQVAGGHRRMVDVARALVSGPRLLLLDEVGAGLTEAEKELVIRVVLEEVEARSMTLVFIEHDLDFVRALGESCFVLHGGRVLASGEPDEVLARQDVLEAYVGASTSTMEEAP